MLLVLPLLAVPFMTLFFWSLGGGKTAQAQAGPGQFTGLNMKVPGAKLKNDSSENKLSFYEQAEKDSLKFKQARKDDPYYKADTSGSPVRKDSMNLHDSGSNRRIYSNGIGTSFSNHSLNNSSALLATDEQQINLKLAALKRQINQPAPLQQASNYAQPDGASDSELNRLRSEMKKMNTDKPDPEMQQLGTMLDKIQAIQNPGLARQKQQEESEKNRGQVFAVTNGKIADPVSNIDNSYTSLQGTGLGQNGFYSLEDPHANDDSQNTISAVIHETQTIVSGATVKLRLLSDIFINGMLIPKDNLVFGIASLDGERLQIKINSIRYRHSLFPVSLSVYDMDGLNGIYIPGAITRDVAKESADQSIQNLGFTTYDPSFGAQAASAGVTAAKSLFSRKVRLVKVQVKAGYQVLLKDEKQKQFNQ